ncbi:MAG: hypothetical protein ACKORL_03030, partial [Phycisphaerales bacterium]
MRLAWSGTSVAAAAGAGTRVSTSTTGGGGFGGAPAGLVARGTDFTEFAALAAAQAVHPAPPVVLVETRVPAPAAAVTDAPLHANRTARRVMQVHGSYLVVEDRDGILVVDQ